MLVYLEANPKGTLKNYIDLLLADGTSDVSVNTLQSDITVWRRKDEAFAESYNELMSARRPGHRRQGAIPLERRPGMEDWQERWINAFAKSGNKVFASAEVGISYESVRRIRSETDDRYDPEFAEAVLEVERLLIADTEGAVFESIQMAREAGDAKTMGHTALQVLERLRKGKWSRQEQRVVEHTGTVNVEIGPREQKAIDAAGQISQRLGFADRPALPRPSSVHELEVLDAEVIGVVDHG